MDGSKRYERLIARRNELEDAQRAALDGLEANGQTWFTAEQADAEKQYDERKQELESLGKAIEEEQVARAARRVEPAMRQITPNDLEAARQANGQQATAQGPFQSMGEQLQAIYFAANPNFASRPEVEKLRNWHAAVTGSSGQVGSEGGFLVQQDFSSALLEAATEESMLLNRTTRLAVGAMSDTVVFNAVKDEDRSSGAVAGGVQVYRVEEAEAPGYKKPTFRRVELRLKKLVGLYATTEELAQDATALQSFVEAGFRTAMAFKVDDEICNGDGAAQMLGFLNTANAALISVAKEAGQAASTIVYGNVRKMKNRVHPRAKMRGAWLIGWDSEEQMETMNFPIGTGGVPVWLPAGGLSSDSFDRLYGRPILPIEHLPTVGTKGDINFVDLTDYITIFKGGIQQASSVHLKFDVGEQVFRWVWRINGCPGSQAAFTPHKGNSRSPYVTLAARA